METKRVTDLPKVTEVKADDLLALHDGVGMKTIKIEDLSTLRDGAGSHNSRYRGKNLGSVITAEQNEAIKTGTFKDMYIGDYWIINDIMWIIAAFDYYYKGGYTACMVHHITLVPDVPLYNHVMNDTATTEGGYKSSKMRTKGLEEAKNIIKSAFGERVLKHIITITSAVANGKPVAVSNADSEVELMNEIMLYGCRILSSTNDGTTFPVYYVLEKTQLPLFAFRPDLISNRQHFWLKDVVDDKRFALSGYYGRANENPANLSFGVRPAFSIKGI